MEEDSMKKIIKTALPISSFYLSLFTFFVSHEATLWIRAGKREHLCPSRPRAQRLLLASGAADPLARLPPQVTVVRSLTSGLRH